jgi:quercetin dioxygenase-like cupin family protein
MMNFSHYRTHVGEDPEKFYKSTVFEGTGLKLGTNCLESGQSQPEHVHVDQDKFYYVVEGHGEFVVGEETRAAGVGMVVWAPAGTKHGVTNNGSTRLVLLVGMARSQPEEAPTSTPLSTRRPLMPTKRVRRSAKRAARKVKKTAKRAKKAVGRAKKKAAKTAKKAKKAAKRARKAVKSGTRKAKRTAKRARKAVKSGTKKAKRTAKRAKKAATSARKKASKTARRTKRALSAARNRAAKTAKRARKAVRRIKKKR